MMKKVLKIISIIFGGILGIILFGFAIYAYLYYPRTAIPFEIDPPNPTEKILIVTQSSDFKDTLVKSLCDSLKSSSVYIKGIDLEMLPQMNSDDWDRILLINTFMIRLDKIVDKFVNCNSTPEKKLLLVTSGGADWQPQPELMVDAITSASRKDEISNLIQLITDWLSKDIDTKWEPSDYLLALKFFPRVDIVTACASIKDNQERYKKIYPNLVSLINQIGYNYLRMEDIKSAVEIFSLNVNLFSDFWNVYDSYGEALLKNGNLKAAISNYQKALELNPNSESTRDILNNINNNLK